jgi:putative transposase
MAYVKIWLHCVWGTKSRINFLKDGIKGSVINHIKAHAKEKGVYIDIIDGHSDHLHCLISLNADQMLANVMQLIKGESSFWINKSHLIKSRFSWAKEYYAVSISDSHVPRVRNYIRNQERHHRRKTWETESDEFITRYGFERVEG